jgi:hypothetical protein
MVTLAGCVPLPKVEPIDELAFGESPPVIAFDTGFLRDKNRAYFKVRSDDALAYYLIQQSRWRSLPRDNAGRQKALVDGGFGPRAINVQIDVPKGRDYYFIPVCGSGMNADFSRMRSLAAENLNGMKVALLTCRP